jgi:hypothetical protein
MADKKISELDSQTGAQTADDDVFVIADVSANVTKKITLSELDNALAARDFNFGDNTKLLMGDSNDLEIFHNASDSIINDAGTGSLKLQTGGSTKLEVTSGGVTVTGSVTGSLTGNADSATQVYVTDPDPDTDANHYILGVASTSSGNKAVVLDGGVYFNPSLNRLYSNSIFLTGAPTSNGFVGFEGATSDSFETFLFATDPTADRAIYLPDLSGTLTVTGASQNVSFGTLTADGGISVDNITIDGQEIDVSSGDLTLDVAGNIVLDADGFVGVGISSPLAPVHISFSNNAGSVTGFLVKNTNTGTTTNFASASYHAVNGTIQSTFGSAHYSPWGGSVAFAGSQTSHPLKLITNNVVRATIAEDGTVSVSDRLLVNGATSNAQLSVLGDASLRAQNVQVATNGHTAVGFFNASGSEVGGISVTSSATAYNTSSDYRLKENVAYSWDATTRLKQLKPARFNFLADADTTVDGFLAHEAMAVVPEAVTGTHNEVDDDGNPVMQGIDQSKLVPLLVKTIQELEARITALEGA